MHIRINFEAVIEMCVCADDVRQDGGPSLSGKPEQEEQTPLLEGAKSEANKHIKIQLNTGVITSHVLAHSRQINLNQTGVYVSTSNSPVGVWVCCVLVRVCYKLLEGLEYLSKAALCGRLSHSLITPPEPALPLPTICSGMK